VWIAVAFLAGLALGSFVTYQVLVRIIAKNSVVAGKSLILNLSTDPE
jgi:hypothetical protein